MQVILTNEEIQLALEAHVKKVINVSSNTRITIEFKPVRGSDAMTAIVDLTSTDAPLVATNIKTFRESETVNSIEEKETPATPRKSIFGTPIQTEVTK